MSNTVVELVADNKLSSMLSSTALVKASSSTFTATLSSSIESSFEKTSSSARVASIMSQIYNNICQIREAVKKLFGFFLGIFPK